MPPLTALRFSAHGEVDSGGPEHDQGGTVPATITRLDGGSVTLDDDRLTELRSTFRGEVVVPGDEGYEAARAGGFNELYADRRPGLVVRCTGTADADDAGNLAA